MDDKEVKAGIEALLFMAADPLSIDDLKEVINLSSSEIRELLTKIKEEYEAGDKGIKLVKISNGFQFQTKAKYRSLVKEFHQPKSNNTLTQAALETLAIIAYKQPVTRPEIEEIRGVNVEKALKTLQKRGLVEKKGEQDTIGCPKLYGTTDQFLQYMGLESLEELPAPQGEEELSQNELPPQEAAS